VDEAVERYRVWQRSHPGRDINPTRLESLVEQAGAKRLTLESPEFTALTPVQIARETAVELLFGGLEDD
jgi:phage-related baseplate assembly protein